ncbi:MAG: thermonuclease family protein [Actinobacteria bacterium]|nr:thermonuclease family protein [Actinomycetota bacterium]
MPIFRVPRRGPNGLAQTTHQRLGVAVSLLILVSSCSVSTDPSSGSFSETSTSTTNSRSTSPGPGGSTESGSVLLVPNAQVVFVIDGDTIEVDIDGIQETVRFIGIDTPEKTGGFRPAECYGDEASERMRQLLDPGDAIRLELDVEARDRFERLLAYVYSPDGLLNELMVAEGYAEAVRFEPNTTLATRFEAAEATAREFNLGLWRDCGSADVLLDPAG